MKTKLSVLSAALLLLAGLLIYFKTGHDKVVNDPADSLQNQRRRSVKHDMYPLEGISRPTTAAHADTRISNPSPQHSPGLRAAIDIRKALRSKSDQATELAGGLPLALPAANVDLGDASYLQSEEHKSDIQKIAEDFQQKIANSGLDPASSEYRKFWNDAVRDSDQLFRARYGEQAWNAHHIQAHHLANSQSSSSAAGGKQSH